MNRKQLIVLALISLILAGMIFPSFCTYAANSKNRNADYSYVIENGNVILTDYSGNEETVTIPKTIDGNPVIELRNTFNSNSTIEKVIIPNGIQTIGDTTFYNCTNLKKVSLPNSVTMISDSSFYGCSKIKRIHLPSKLQRIGRWAFAYTSIKSITIPKNVKMISEYGFFGCYNLKMVIILSNDLTIYSYAFSETSVEYISADKTLPDYSENAFPDDSTISSSEGSSASNNPLSPLLSPFITAFLAPLSHVLKIPRMPFFTLFFLVILNIIAFIIAGMIKIFRIIKMHTNVAIKSYISAEQDVKNLLNKQNIANDIYYNKKNISIFTKVLIIEFLGVLILGIITVLGFFTNELCDYLGLTFSLYILITVIAFIIMLVALYFGYIVYKKLVYKLQPKNRVRIKRINK